MSKTISISFVKNNIDIWEAGKKGVILPKGLLIPTTLGGGYIYLFSENSWMSPKAWAEKACSFACIIQDRAFGRGETAAKVIFFPEKVVAGDVWILYD